MAASCCKTGLTSLTCIKKSRLRGILTLSRHTFLKTQLSVSLSCRMDSAAWLVSSNCPEKIAHQNAAPIKITSNREIGSSRNKDASMAYPCAAAACQPPCGRVYLRYKRQELAATR